MCAAFEQWWRRVLSRREQFDDPLLDLTICPTCGTDLSEKENAA